MTTDFNPTDDELEVLATDYLEVACYDAFCKAKLSEVDSITQCEVRPSPRLKNIEIILGEERMRDIRGSVFDNWDERILNAHDLCRGHGVDYAGELEESWLDWLWQNSEPNRLLV